MREEGRGSVPGGQTWAWKPRRGSSIFPLPRRRSRFRTSPPRSLPSRYKHTHAAVGLRRWEGGEGKRGRGGGNGTNHRTTGTPQVSRSPRDRDSDGRNVSDQQPVGIYRSLKKRGNNAQKSHLFVSNFRFKNVNR